MNALEWLAEKIAHRKHISRECQLVSLKLELTHEFCDELVKLLAAPQPQAEPVTAPWCDPHCDCVVDCRALTNYSRETRGEAAAPPAALAANKENTND